VLEYLGKAETLLRRLQGIGGTLKVKSHTHGAVAALLVVARKLDVASVINRYIHSSRSYWPDKPLRNNLTAGITLALAGIGRVCMPTSKRGWWTWARTASLEYLLRVSLSKVDSQRFWDLMDCLPEDAIEKVELDILRNVQQHYGFGDDTLNNIRLSTVLEMSGKRGKPRATRQLEEMTEDQMRLVDALNLADVHKKPLKIKGVSVYN